MECVDPSRMADLKNILLSSNRRRKHLIRMMNRHGLNPSTLRIHYIGSAAVIGSPVVGGVLRNDVWLTQTLIEQQTSFDVNALCICWPNYTQKPLITYSATLLTLAVRVASNHVVKKLLQHGADPNVKSDFTPLGVAVQMNNFEMVSILVNAGADLDLTTHPVLNWKKKNFCRSQSRSLTDFRQTSLHIAVRKGHHEMARLLLIKGASVDSRDGSDSSLLVVARKYGHTDIEQAIEGEIKDNEYVRTATALRNVASRGDFENIRELQGLKCCGFLNELLDRKTPYTERTPLHRACMHNDYDAVKILLAEPRTSVNACDIYLNTPLHYASQNGHQNIIALLATAGADPCLVNIDGKTAVEFVLDHGHIDCVFDLIQSARSPLPERCRFWSDVNGDGLLHIACKCNGVDVVRVLLDNGALLSTVNRTGLTPLQYAWRSGSDDLLKLITNRLIGRNVVELNEFMCKVAADHPSHVHTIQRIDGQDSFTTFCLECRKLRPQTVYYLYRLGVNDWSLLVRSCCGYSGTTLLHIHCDKESWEATYKKNVICHAAAIGSLTDRLTGDAKFLHQSSPQDKFIEEIIDAGADVNAVDEDGNTALHIACLNGIKEMVDDLLSNHADTRVLNASGRTALWCAFEMNHGDLVRWMVLCKKVEVDDDVQHGINSNQETLLRMLFEASGHSIGLCKLVEQGVRLNTPVTSGRRLTLSTGRFNIVTFIPRPMSFYSLGLHRGRAPFSGLVCAAVTRGDLSLAQCLIAAGCKDFARSELFALSTDKGWWRWLLSAGFRPTSGQDSQMIVNGFGDIDESIHVPSLFHLCVHVVRDKLIQVEPHGKTIFAAIDRLPLPNALKDSLKLKNEVQLLGENLTEKCVSCSLRPCYRLFDTDWLSEWSMLNHYMSRVQITRCEIMHTYENHSTPQPRICRSRCSPPSSKHWDKTCNRRLQKIRLLQQPRR